MLRDDAVSLIKQRLRRETDTTLDARIVLEMQLVQEIQEGAPHLPWFLRTVATSSTVANQESLPTASDFLRGWDDGALWYKKTTDTKWLPVEKDDYEPNYNRFGDVPSTLRTYSLGEGVYVFSPIPDAIFDLRSIYYATARPLTSNIENVWLKYVPDLLIAETGIRIAKLHVRDESSVELFAAESSAAESRLRKIDVARKMANRKMTMGD